MEFINDIRGKFARLSLVALLLGVVVVSLAACGGAEATPTPTTATDTGAATEATATPARSQSGSSSSGATTEIAATLNEWSINLNAAQVSAGQVKFTVANEGNSGHDLVVLDNGGNQVGATPVFHKADGAKEFTVYLKPGTYTIVCDVPGHTAQGMKTTLTVK